MIAGCIVLGAILCSILVLAAKAFPAFMQRLRIGLHSADRHPRERNIPGSHRAGRVIEFPLSRVSGR